MVEWGGAPPSVYRKHKGTSFMGYILSIIMSYSGVVLSSLQVIRIHFFTVFFFLFARLMALVVRILSMPKYYCFFKI